MSTDEKEPFCPFGDQVRQVREPGDVHKVGRRAELEADAADALTISVWIAVDEPPASTSEPYGVIFEKRAAKGGYPYALHYLRKAGGDGAHEAAEANDANDGRLRASRSDGKITSTLLAKTKVNDHRFHHVALVRERQGDKAKLLLYVDGMPEDTVTDTTTSKAGNRAALAVGGRLVNGSPTHPFFGLVRHLAVYRRALGGDEISRLAAERISPVLITAIGYRGKVKHSQADEYIELMNWDASPADISGWQVGSERGQRAFGQRPFVFPPATMLLPRQRVRVYSNQVHAEWGGYTFASGTAIWNDQGDLGVLRDARGKEISRWSYGDELGSPAPSTADSTALSLAPVTADSTLLRLVPSPAPSTADSPAPSTALSLVPSIVTPTAMEDELAEALAWRQAQGDDIVRRSMYWAGGISLVPVPLVDIVGAVSVVLVMLQEMAELYQVPFSRQRAKSLVAALIGGMGGVGVGTSAILSVVKVLPVFGWLAAGLAAPTAAMVSTYAIGKVFLQHFEAGGTLLDFDPAAMRRHFREQLRHAPQVIAAIRDKASTSAF